MHEANDVATELARKSKRLFRDRRILVIVVALLSLLLIWLIVHRFSPKSEQVECAFRIPKSAQAPETKGDAYRANDCVQLELAATNSARTLGLSGRKSMDNNRGMVFDFVRTGEYCMWMKDMNFSLDMIWLNPEREIVYMIENVTPDTYPKSFCGPDTANYIVEVNAGIVKAADLRIGQRLRF